MLIVHTSTPEPSAPASWLKRRVSVSQTGVSSEGTALRMTTLPAAADLSETGWSALSVTVKSGAGWPGLTSVPPRVTGLPRRVTLAMEDLLGTCGLVGGVAPALGRALGLEAPGLA